MRFYPPKTTTIERENSTLNKGEIVLDWDNNKLYVGTGGIGGVEIGTGTGSGTGDMLKSTYDTDNDGIVDQAEVAFVADLATNITGSPSANQYYGTNASGTKGFYNLPEGSGAVEVTVPRNQIQAMVLAGLTI